MRKTIENATVSAVFRGVVAWANENGTGNLGYTKIRIDTGAANIITWVKNDSAPEEGQSVKGEIDYSTRFFVCDGDDYTRESGVFTLAAS
jgi:hypothetical protein